jgi:hypothetical protein
MTMPLINDRALSGQRRRPTSSAWYLPDSNKYLAFTKTLTGRQTVGRNANMTLTSTLVRSHLELRATC